MSFFTRYPVSKECLIAHFESEFDIANFGWVTHFQPLFNKPIKDIIKEIIEVSLTDAAPAIGELVYRTINSYYNSEKCGNEHYGVMQSVPYNVHEILNKVNCLLPLTPISAEPRQWKTSREDAFLMTHKRCPRLNFYLLNNTYSLVDGLSLMKPNALLTDFVSAGHRDRIFKESDFPLTLETSIGIGYEVDGSNFSNKSKADKELLNLFDKEGLSNMFCKIRESNDLLPTDTIMFTEIELKAGLNFFFKYLTTNLDDEIPDIRKICSIKQVMTKFNNSTDHLNVLAVAYGIYKYLENNRVSKLKKIREQELGLEAEIIGVSETNYGITYFMIGLFKEDNRTIFSAESNLHKCIRMIR